MFCKFDDTEFIVVFNLFFLKVEHVDILYSFVSMRIKYGKQMGKQWKLWETLFFGGSKINADGDCSHEIPRCLLLGRKIMTNLDSILKSRDITLPTKVHRVKAVVFPVVNIQMWQLDHKESWAPKNWCFWTVVLEKILVSPLDCKKI